MRGHVDGETNEGVVLTQDGLSVERAGGGIEVEDGARALKVQGSRGEQGELAVMDVCAVPAIEDAGLKGVECFKGRGLSEEVKLCVRGGVDGLLNEVMDELVVMIEQGIRGDGLGELRGGGAVPGSEEVGEACPGVILDGEVVVCLERGEL